MTLKIHPALATAIIAGILILCFALFKGCKQSKIEVAAKEQATHIADSALVLLKESKSSWDSTEQNYKYSLQQSQTEKEFIVSQKEQAEAKLDKALKENKDLIAKHNLAEYTDTATTLVPAEYISDCESCFTKLNNTTRLTLKYKNDINNLQANLNEQDQIYQKRFKQLDQERLGFYNKINSLAKEAKDATDKLKPHGRLYLSWGVLWKPVPWAAGAGLLYQTKDNMIYGARWYYSSTGQIIETTLNFPLSLKFK